MFLLILAIYSLNNLDSIFNPSLNESNLYSGDFSLIQDLSDLSGGMKADKDTTGGKEIPFWKRLNYSIGYSGGLCYTGEDLRKYVGDMTFDPMVALKINLYWLNSIELSAIYPMEGDRGIEVGVGFGWTELNERNGWDNSFSPPDTTYMYGNLGGGVNVDMKRINIFVGKIMQNKSVGIEIGYTYFKTIEVLSYYRPNENWTTIDKSNVIRHCIGGGIYLFVNHLVGKMDRMLIFLYGGGKFAFDFEILNNSPFKWTGVEKKESINFSGIYVGIKMNIGGVK